METEDRIDVIVMNEFLLSCKIRDDISILKLFDAYNYGMNKFEILSKTRDYFWFNEYKEKKIQDDYNRLSDGRQQRTIYI